MELAKLLKPRSVAIVGASEKEGFGGDTVRTVLSYAKDLSGIYFVNPKWETVFGRRCYRTLGDIPGTIDLAVICTPKETVNGILREAAKKGCGGAVVYASGYGETGEAGKAEEAELKRLCESLGIALMGPNCAGFANYIDGVFAFAFLTEKRERRGGVGMVSQSGQICLSGLDWPAVSFSYIISSGNGAGVTVENYMEFLVDDEDTKVVAVYIEGVRDAPTLVRALRKAALKRKPVVILKTGRSARAGRLASSHTGSIAGSDRAFDALMWKYGAVRADDIQELLGAAAMFSTLKSLPRGSKYACVNVSGGEAGCIADLAYLAGVEFAELEPGTLRKLRDIMPAYATPDNPLDMTATLAYDEGKFALGLRAMMEDGGVAAVLVGYTLLGEINDTSIVHMAAGIGLAAGRSWSKPVIMVPFVEHTRNPEYLKKLASLGVPVLPSGVYALRLLRHLGGFTAYDPQKRTFEAAMGSVGGRGAAAALSEHESKLLLARHGIPIPEECVAATALEAQAVAARLGCPLAMKIASPDISHKSDVGGVRLNVGSGEAGAAFDAIIHSAQEHCPKARIDGVLVHRMLPRGVEMIVGVSNDPVLGPMVLLGAGGVYAELLGDTALYPAPMSLSEAMGMIKSLRAWPILSGLRGEKPCDIAALAQFIVKIAAFACENWDSVKELDINPLFVYPEGGEVAMADALIIRYIK